MKLTLIMTLLLTGGLTMGFQHQARALDLESIAKEVLKGNSEGEQTANPPPAQGEEGSVPVPGSEGAQLGAGLSNNEIGSGLKQMLKQGVDRAITTLGQENGFLNNEQAKIPLPQSLQPVAKGLEKMGQGKLVDDFVATMNHAAEKAVPEAGEVFANTLDAMTMQDVTGILNGPKNAATDYFRKNSGDELKQRFLPIVKQATDKSGVTTAYKQLKSQMGNLDLGPLNSLLGGGESGELDLDQYITEHTLDGLFELIAKEEAKIRQNPAARTTDLLERIFGGK